MQKKIYSECVPKHRFHRTLVYIPYFFCAVKHIGLDLSGVIKHIDAPHWASRSKNSHGASDHWINYVFEQYWSSLDAAKPYQCFVIIKLSFITHTFSI